MSGRSYKFLRDLDDAARHEKQMGMIYSYCDFLEEPPKGLIHDTSLLPQSKDDLLVAFREQIAVHPDAGKVRLMSLVVTALARYQEGVGPSYTLPPSDEIDDAQPDPDKIVALAKKWAWDDRFPHFNNLVSNDLKLIGDLIRDATAENPAMQPAPKTFWQRLFSR